MNTGWAPKPLRPDATNPLFEMVEAPIVVKGLSPIQRQRLADGTPHTVTGPTALRAPDPALVLPETLVKKGSLVEKYDERPKQPKQDPEDPMTVVKSYLAFEGKDDPDSDSKEKMQRVHKSIETMRAAINDFVKKSGADVEEDEKKALGAEPPKAKGTQEPKQAKGPSMGNAVAGGARTVMSAVAGAVGRK
jgi:hypothetical protein